MPELPEVETVRRQLLPIVEGRTIRSVTTRAAMLFQNCDPEVKISIGGENIWSG